LATNSCRFFLSFAFSTSTADPISSLFPPFRPPQQYRPRPGASAGRREAEERQRQSCRFATQKTNPFSFINAPRPDSSPRPRSRRRFRREHALAPRIDRQSLPQDRPRGLLFEREKEDARNRSRGCRGCGRGRPAEERAPEARHRSPRAGGGGLDPRSCACCSFFRRRLRRRRKRRRGYRDPRGLGPAGGEAVPRWSSKGEEAGPSDGPSRRRPEGKGGRAGSRCCLSGVVILLGRLGRRLPALLRGRGAADAVFRERGSGRGRERTATKKSRRSGRSRRASVRRRSSGAGAGRGAASVLNWGASSLHDRV